MKAYAIFSLTAAVMSSVCYSAPIVDADCTIAVPSGRIRRGNVIQTISPNDKALAKLIEKGYFPYEVDQDELISGGLNLTWQISTDGDKSNIRAGIKRLMGDDKNVIVVLPGTTYYPDFVKAMAALPNCTAGR